MKAFELTIILVLLIFAFFAGVIYSNSVKESSGWLFEVKEAEELPELPKNNKPTYIEEKKTENIRQPNENNIYNIEEPSIEENPDIDNGQQEDNNYNNY